MSPEPENQIDKVNEYKAALKSAVSRMLSDRLPSRKVDVLFYHGRSFGDDDPIIAYAAKLIQDGRADHILVHGNDGQTVGGNEKYKANAGKSEVARKLNALGIDIFDRVWFSSQDSLNTRTETTSYFDMASKKGWKTIGIVAHPHQLARIMLGTVNEMNKRGIYLPVYLGHPQRTDWDEIVFGSQGAENKPRREHIFDEMIRIPRYQKPKDQKPADLATFDELDAYLEKRGWGPRDDMNWDRIEANPNVENDYKIISEYIDRLTPDQIFSG